MFLQALFLPWKKAFSRYTSTCMHIICIFFKYTFHQDRRLAFVCKPQWFFFEQWWLHFAFSLLCGPCVRQATLFQHFWHGLICCGSGLMPAPGSVGAVPSAPGACAVVTGILARVLPCWLSQGSNNLLGLPCWDLAPPLPLLFHLLGEIGSSEQPFHFPSLTKVFHK